MSTKAPQQAPLKPLSILVAGDDADTVMTLAAILRHEWHTTIHTATTGPLAMEAIRRWAPEVCILDVEMPGQSGYAIAREVQALYGPRRPLDSDFG